jgi:hypothetical protein
MQSAIRASREFEEDFIDLCASLCFLVLPDRIITVSRFLAWRKRPYNTLTGVKLYRARFARQGSLKRILSIFEQASAFSVLPDHGEAQDEAGGAGDRDHRSDRKVARTVFDPAHVLL